MILNIGIIGSGNVASHLATIFIEKGLIIKFIYSPNKANATLLAQKVNALVVNSLDFSKQKIDLLILAIKDDVIEDICTQIKLPNNAIIAHTSGSISIDALNNFENTGIFYPLQTFTKDKAIDFGEVPILIEALQPTTTSLLLELGKKISSNVLYVDSEKRKIIHLAAVFTNNFTNALLTIAENLLSEHQVDSSILYPLAQETIAKAKALGAKNAQTGPAKREDIIVQKEHLKLLNQEKYKEIYILISKLIAATK